MQTLAAAAAALANGATTARALVETCLANAQAPSGQGPATFTRLYADQARAMADAMDTLRGHNRHPSPWAGIPISIKDLFDIAGETTAAGSRALANSAPATATAPAIARLLAAGLVPIGRTNMTEFAFSGVGINPHFGTPLSPWDRATGRIPGGSSSGAAVSVADGMALAGIGTDTGGSCRIPAALCGITGYKPTQARIPRHGAVPLSQTLDSVGPLAPSAACCAIIDALLAGYPTRRLAPVPPAGLRILLPTNFAFDHLDGPTEAAFDRAISRLDRAGAIIDRRPLLAIDAMNQANATGGFAAVEAFAWHEALLATHESEYDPRVATRIRPGSAMTAAQYIRLLSARAETIALFAQEMAGFDALILPTVPIAPPALAAFAEDAEYRRLNFLLLRNCAAVNFLDGCAISLPCQAAGAPPAGLMLAAPGFQDDRLLGIAMGVQDRLN